MDLHIKTEEDFALECLTRTLQRLLDKEGTVAPLVARRNLQKARDRLIALLMQHPDLKELTLVFDEYDEETPRAIVNEADEILGKRPIKSQTIDYVCATIRTLEGLYICNAIVEEELAS